MGSSQQWVHITAIRNSSKYSESYLYNHRRQLDTLRRSNETVGGRRKIVGSAALVVHTSSPVQNMGHLCHGVSLASPNHALKYGVRTVKGTTGGVSFDAPTGRLSRAEPAVSALKSQYIGKSTTE